jgi:hypothetical protein
MSDLLLQDQRLVGCTGRFFDCKMLENMQPPLLICSMVLICFQWSSASDVADDKCQLTGRSDNVCVMTVLHVCGCDMTGLFPIKNVIQTDAAINPGNRCVSSSSQYSCVKVLNGSPQLMMCHSSANSFQAHITPQ